MFIPNASGYKTRCENRRGKGTAKKICFKYPRLFSWALVREIPFACNGLFNEEEACEGGITLWREQDVVTCQRNKCQNDF